MEAGYSLAGNSLYWVVAPVLITVLVFDKGSIVECFDGCILIARPKSCKYRI